MKNPMDYVRPNILALEPYSTARDECKGGDISVWLDANENPFDNGVNRYPDPHHKELKRHVAALKGVKEDQLFLGGAGSDEAIDLTSGYSAVRVSTTHSYHTELWGIHGKRGGQ